MGATSALLLVSGGGQAELAWSKAPPRLPARRGDSCEFLTRTIFGRTQTFVLDTRTIDPYRCVNPETGFIEQRSTMASDEELHAREVNGLKRSLEGVEFRLLHAGKVFHFEEPMPAEKLKPGARGSRPRRPSSSASSSVSGPSSQLHRRRDANERSELHPARSGVRTDRGG